MALTSTENNGNLNQGSNSSPVIKSNDLFPDNNSGQSSFNPNSTGKQDRDLNYDYSQGRWGIDNWLRNFFSFGEYNKKRDADYQQWLNNTAVQRRMLDMKNAGVNPVLAAQGLGASTTGSAGISNNSYSETPFNSASKKAKSDKDTLKMLMPLIMAVLL